MKEVAGNVSLNTFSNRVERSIPRC